MTLSPISYTPFDVCPLLPLKLTAIKQSVPVAKSAPSVRHLVHCGKHWQEGPLLELLLPFADGGMSAGAVGEVVGEGNRCGNETW